MAFMARTSSPSSQKLQAAQVLHLGSKVQSLLSSFLPPRFSWMFQCISSCPGEIIKDYLYLCTLLGWWQHDLDAAAHWCGNTNNTAKSMFKIRYKRHWSLPNAVTSALPTCHSTAFQLRPCRLHPSVHSWGAGWPFSTINPDSDRFLTPP